MEPIPETTAAVNEFGPFATEGDLLDRLRETGRRVQDIVPECVGMSLALTEHGVTFTLVATDEHIAALDGLQYLDTGPCVTSVEAERVLEFSEDDIVAEGRWQMFARGTAAAGISSTLTLPIVVAGRVAGSINLYAAAPTAFTSHHVAIARLFDAWAPGAVTNADLGFETRRTAQGAPQLLHDETRIHVAVGVIRQATGSSIQEARAVLAQAAARAGITEAALAETMIRQTPLQRRRSLEP